MSDLTRRALFAQAAARTEPRPRATGRTLIQNCDAVITMDAAGGELPGGDVLMVGDRIVAVGKGLAAADAEVVDGRGALLMPGMIDGYRRTWQSLLVGAQVDIAPRRDTGRAMFAAKAAALRAEDLRLGAHIGGLSAIDSGVTTLVDHPSAADTPAKIEAAALGLKDSGVAGVFCCPLTGAADPVIGRLRATHFTDPRAPLRIGAALAGDVDAWSPAAARDAFAKARALNPALIALGPQHIRLLADAGLLGPDVHIVHGGALADEELRLMAAAGATLASACMEEYVSPDTPAHGRARAAGVATGIGVGSPVAYTLDPFEHLRAAFFSLFRTKQGFDVAAPYKSPDTLAFATSDGARAIGLGQEIGSITVGKRADLVLVSTRRFGFAMLGSPADRLVNFAAQEDIDSVWLAGVARKRRGVMLGVDWRDLKTRMAAAQSALFAKAA